MRQFVVQLQRWRTSWVSSFKYNLITYIYIYTDLLNPVAHQNKETIRSSKESMVSKAWNNRDWLWLINATLVNERQKLGNCFSRLISLIDCSHWIELSAFDSPGVSGTGTLGYWSGAIGQPMNRLTSGKISAIVVLFANKAHDMDHRNHGLTGIIHQDPSTSIFEASPSSTSWATCFFMTSITSWSAGPGLSLPRSTPALRVAACACRARVAPVSWRAKCRRWGWAQSWRLAGWQVRGSAQGWWLSWV